jgi:hypothetical protein
MLNQLKSHHEQELSRLRALAADARNSVESQLQQKVPNFSQILGINFSDRVLKHHCRLKSVATSAFRRR